MQDYRKWGLKLEKFDKVVALAGNPNTGKSTVFNCPNWLKSTHWKLAWQNRDSR